MINVSNEELIIKYKNGDRRALDIIIENNQGIVHKIARKYNIENQNFITIDDLIQEGNIGVIIAANKYNLEMVNKCAFITYAVYWIQSKISRLVTRNNTNYECSLNEKIGEEDNSERVNFLKDDTDYIDENIKVLDNIELRKELLELIKNNLSLKKREIIRLNYGFNSNTMSLVEIAEIFGLDSKEIRNIREGALNDLRKTQYIKDMAKEMYDINNIGNRIFNAERYVCLAEEYDKWF